MNAFRVLGGMMIIGAGFLLIAALLLGALDVDIIGGFAR